MATSQAKANFAPLSPVNFLLRSAKFFADQTAIIYGDRSFTYREFYTRVQKLAGALKAAGIAAGDTVAVMAPNVPPMLEAHYAVPLVGGILLTHNILLDPALIAYQWTHTNPKLLICDREYVDLARQALQMSERDLSIVVANDPAAGLPSEPGTIEYETFLGDAPDAIAELELEDELQSLCVLYTSGTTAVPKGVVYSHRGAYLASLSNALSFGLTHNSVHLWTWPMFHSNGLSFVWAVTAVGGVHVCLRTVNARNVFDLIGRHRVSHFCMPPSVMNMLVEDSESTGVRFEHEVNCITGGAPPPLSILRNMEALGIEVTHQYGSTECYGAATVAWRRPQFDQMTTEERHAFMARQGTPMPVVDDLIVADPDSMQPVAQDGTSLGEVMVRGNTVMLGYLGDHDATNDVMDGGWFRTGDIAVWHDDGSIEIKDRSVDAIVSEGERISSVEIEYVLYHHPKVYEAAVIAKPDKTRGEVPCAFVSRVSGSDVDGEELAAYCRSHLESVKVPKHFVFCDLPKTATGKIKKSELREMAKQLKHAEPLQY